MKKTILKSALLTILGLGLMAGNAMALPYLSGEVGFVGLWHGGIGVANSAIGVATDVHFEDPDMDGYNASVLFSNGMLSGMIPVGTDNATFMNFTFNPFVPPIMPLWTAGPVSFKATSLNIDLQTSSALVLSGGGYLMAPGYQDTMGYYNFTGNEWTWSAATLAKVEHEPTNEVPEPATMILFGTGLAGLAGLRRKKAAQA